MFKTIISLMVFIFLQMGPVFGTPTGREISSFVERAIKANGSFANGTWYMGVFHVSIVQDDIRLDGFNALPFELNQPQKLGFVSQYGRFSFDFSLKQLDGDKFLFNAKVTSVPADKKLPYPEDVSKYKGVTFSGSCLYMGSSERGPVIVGKEGAQRRVLTLLFVFKNPDNKSEPAKDAQRQ